MKNITKILWGLVLVALGTIISLNTLEITDIDIFFDGWWTLFIIVPSFIGLFDRSGRGCSAVFLIIGIALMLACRGIIDFELCVRLIVPVLLIIIGLSIIWTSIFAKKIEKKFEAIGASNQDDMNAIFKEEIYIVDREVAYSKIEAVFGHAVVDLRKAKFDKDLTVKAETVFGSIDLLLPEGVNVKVQSTKVFGGLNNIHGSDEKAKKTIYIEANIVFGGINLK